MNICVYSTLPFLYHDEGRHSFHLPCLLFRGPTIRIEVLEKALRPVKFCDTRKEPRKLFKA